MAQRQLFEAILAGDLERVMGVLASHPEEGVINSVIEDGGHY